MFYGFFVEPTGLEETKDSSIKDINNIIINLFFNFKT